MHNVNTQPSVSPHSAAADAANAGLDPRVSAGKAEEVESPLSDRTAVASIQPLDIDLNAEIDVMGQMAHDCVDLRKGTDLPEGFDSVARFYEVYPDVQTFYKKQSMLPSMALATGANLHKFMNAGYLRALAHIQANTSTEGLEVALLGSNELPSDIGALTQLETLTIDPQVMPPTSLVSHFITLPKSAPPMRVHLPTTLWALKQLTSLNLSRSSKGVLPSEITTLPQLKTLDVSDNELTEIPSWIARCQALKTLIASQNQLATLPVELKQCSALETLELWDNPIATMALPTMWGRAKQAAYDKTMRGFLTNDLRSYNPLRAYLIETYTPPTCDVVIEEHDFY